MRRDLACKPECRADCIRASGDVECEQCSKLYRDHPYCAGSRLPDNHYFLHVLCDGTHVKL